MAGKIHLAIPAVGAYRQYAEVTAASAVRGSSLPVEVHFIDWTVISQERLEKLGRWHGSAIAFSRLFLAELFPDLDWVISCDADVLFRGDIAKLWALRDDSVSIVASQDHPFPGEPLRRLPFQWYDAKGLEFKDPRRYFCDGLCLCNLKRWRGLGLQARFENLARRYDDWPSPDQMIINYVLQNDSKLLPSRWGCFSGDANSDIDYDGDCAIHFVSDPPWKRIKPTQLISEAVVLWRKAAGLPYGGWRRWLYLAFGKTWGFWRHVPWVSSHYRNAARYRDAKRIAIGVMHPAPYRQPVLDRLRAMNAFEVDVFSNLPVDPNHMWAGFEKEIGALYRGNGFAALCRALVRYVFSPRYDLVCWSAYYPYWLTIPIVFSALIGKSYAISVDTVREEGGWLARRIKKFIFSRAGFLWVPGLATRRFLEGQYNIVPEKIVEGVYALERFESSADSKSEEREGRPFKFLMICNNLLHRRVDVVVKGFEKFSTDRLDVQLVLCGKDMERFVPVRNVKVIDGCPWLELPELYADADVYVHNGTEQFSTTVLMAAQRGMPLIVGREVGVARDLFTDDARLGVCVEDWQSEEAWAIAFDQVIADRQRWKEMGDTGRLRAGKFDADAIAAAVGSKIKEVLSR